jgi:hypothetical protein
METLKDVFKRIIDDQVMWNYYGNKKLIDCIKDGEYNRFLEDYIKSGGKGSIISERLSHPKSESHVFSTFFFGIILYHEFKVIKDNVDKKLMEFKKVDPKADVDFRFFWYLISMFHDSGYYFEDKEQDDDCMDAFDLNCFYGKNSIRHRLKLLGVPSKISNSWKRYYIYRRNHYKKIDHGISGGVLLFNTLSEKYEELRKNHNKDSFKEKKLYWSKGLLKAYRLAASVIVAHNIFWAKEGKDDYVDRYKNYELDQLIIGKDSKPIISLKRHPFLFLLCLVDSIELSKIVDVKSDNLEMLEFFKSFKLNPASNEILIDCNCGRTNSILSLPNWLPVSVCTVNEDGRTSYCIKMSN